MFSENQIQDCVKENFDSLCDGVHRIDIATDTPNFIFEASKKFFFLKIFLLEKYDEIIFEADLLCFLNTKDFLKGRVPTIRKVFTSQDSIFVVYDFIEAEQLSENFLDEILIEKIAKLHAYFHDSTIDFLSSGKRKRVDLFDFTFIQNLRRKGEIDYGVFKYVTDFSEYTPSTSLHKTIIHEDMSKENFLLKENNPILIDFGESHFGYRISDVAILVTELFIDESEISFDKIKKYINYYNNYATKKLDFEEYKILAFSILRRALFMQNYYLENLKKFPKDIYLRKKEKVSNIWLNISAIDDMSKNFEI